MIAELQIGDLVRLRKTHPCGGVNWKVVRLGADIGIKCLICARRLTMPRASLEKRVKNIVPKQKA